MLRGKLPPTPKPVAMLMQTMMQASFVLPRLGVPKLDKVTVNYGVTERLKRCSNCSFYIPPPQQCIVVDGNIAPNGLCDAWLRNVLKPPVLTFKGLDIGELWRAVGEKNWYAHNVVAVFPEQGLVIIEDGSSIPGGNRFGMPFEFINMHTHNNHGWSDEEIKQFLL